MKVPYEAIIRTLLGLLIGAIGLTYGSVMRRIDRVESDVTAIFARTGVLEVQHVDVLGGLGAVRDRATKLEATTEKLDDRQRQSEASIRNRP